MNIYWAVAILGLALTLSACDALGATVTPSPSASATGSSSPAMAECSPGYPMPSEVVRLGFPCGPTAELHPIQRGVTSTGEEAIADVLRLFLADPDARERQIGFSSLLSPGDIEVVEIGNGRLVLGLPTDLPPTS